MGVIPISSFKIVTQTTHFYFFTSIPWLIWGNGVGYNIFVVCENTQFLPLTDIALICEYLNKTNKTPFSNSQICHRKYTAQNANTHPKTNNTI